MNKTAIGALVVVVIAIVWAYFALSNGAVGISAASVETLTPAPSYFSMGSGTYSFSVAQTGNSMAYVYVDKLPVFMNQPMEVMVEENNMTRINADSGSFANMGITLQSVNGNSVKVEITPLEASLGLAPDTARISTVNNMLLANGRKNVTTSITTTATTTVASTTTVSQINTTSANIMAALKKNKSYAVMQNYTVLYANSANCTQSKYNSAYLKYYGVMPTGPEDYLNVSTFPLPYGFYTKTTNIGRGNYSFVYKSESTDSDYNNSPAVTILINVSGSSAYNVTFGGIFEGQTYLGILDGYNKAAGIGGPCAAVVP